MLFKQLLGIAAVAALCALGALMMITGLGEAAFGDHIEGMFRMISGAVVFTFGTRLWDRLQDKEDSE